jgi:hypothetical protein
VTIGHKDPAKIQQVREAAENYRLFSTFIPIPDKLAKTDSPCMNHDTALDNINQYGYSDWYQFCVGEWGTKWEVECEIIDHTIPTDLPEHVIALSFDSAWSPPIAFYHWLAGREYSVRAYFHEGGMAFAGKWSDLTGPEDYEFSDLSIDEIDQLLPKDLNDMFSITEMMTQWEEGSNLNNILVDTAAKE